MIKTFVTTSAIACIALLANAVMGQELPKGWIQAGNRPADYKMSVDKNVAHSGKASASLKSIATETGGFGTLMQTFKADTFRGKRVKMSGFVKSSEIGGWAGLWMRVDGAILPGSKIPEPLAFDNMEKRPVKGTTDWTKYEIVLDVPERAQEIAFGLLLTGKGQAWMDDLNFEVVGKDVATTGANMSEESHTTPVNLNFED